MSLFKTTPDFCIRKTTGTFAPTLTLAGGTARWDFGDGTAETVTNSPSKVYISTGIPALINLIDTDVGYFNNVTGIDLSSQNLTAVDISRFNNVSVVNISDNDIRGEDICRVLVHLDQNGLTGGTLDYSNNFSECADQVGRTAYDNLIAKGWSITGTKPLSSFIFTVKTDNTGETANDQMRIPLNDWSGDFVAEYDGTSTLISVTGDSSITLTFPSGTGTYDVKFTPVTTCSGQITFNRGNNSGSLDGRDHEKVIGIKQWGSDIAWTSFVSSFEACFNLVSISATDAPDTTTNSVIGFGNAFYQCDYPTFDVTGWDVSNATSISNFFRANSSLTTVIGLDTWTLSTSPIVNITLREMFSACPQIGDLSGMNNWDMTRVTDIQSCFSGCNALVNIDTSLWNLENCLSMTSMFNTCFEITTIDTSNWNTVSNFSFTNTFADCRKLTSINTSGLVTGNATTFSSMFRDCESLTSIDVSNFDMSSATTVIGMFQDCLSLTSIDISNFVGSFNSDSMFYLSANLTTVTLPVSGFAPTSMTSCFRGCISLTTINNFNAIDMSNNTSINHLLNSTAITSADFSNFDLSNCTNWGITFSGCFNLVSIDFTGVTMNTSSPYSAVSCFQNCSSLTTLTNFENLDWSLCNNIQQTFNGCSSLTSVDLSNFPIVSPMQSTFDFCTNLTTVIFPVAGFTPTRTVSMFRGCDSLTTLTNFVNIDWTECTDAERMFENCDVLPSIDLSGATFTNCDDFYRMFLYCQLLETVNMTGVTFPKASTRLQGMFQLCGSNMTVTGLGAVDISNVDDMLYMFSDSTIQTASYDAILTGWEGGTPPSGINFHGGNSQYSSGAPATARANLIANDSWTITDGGQVP